RRRLDDQVDGDEIGMLLRHLDGGRGEARELVEAPPPRRRGEVVSELVERGERLLETRLADVVRRRPALARADQRRRGLEDRLLPSQPVPPQERTAHPTACAPAFEERHTLARLTRQAREAEDLARLPVDDL